MTTLRRCFDMLERQHIPYLHTTHPNAYRATEVAAAEHLPPHMLAKTVIMASPTGYIMAVLPADCRIDLEHFAAMLNVDQLRLATEEEVRELFPESEVGAMPPFGAPIDMPIYLDIRLATETYMLFNAGTHRDAIHMRVADYLRSTTPTIVRFAYPCVWQEFSGSSALSIPLAN